MKKYILLAIIFIVSISSVKSQVYRYIPDSCFRSFLSSIGCPFDISRDSMDISSSVVLSTRSIYTPYFSNIHNIDGIQYFNNLDTLDCYNSPITTVPSLPSRLTYLVFVYNQISTLPTLPSGLKNFYIVGNHLSSLPVLPDSLTILNCSNNILTSLPVLPSTLRDFGCSNNLINSLPTLPDSLKTLYCSDNPLGSLPILPVGLTALNCSNTSISTLPLLPSRLTIFDCSNNLLGTIPTLPTGLTEFHCSNTSLSVLPLLPSGLTIFDCSNNALGSLPTLPVGLTNLSCSNDSISSLPILPSGLTSLNCSYNPSLFCLPYLPNTLRNIHYDSTSINCIPNYVSGASYYPSIGTYPFCNPYIHSCPSYVSINGNTFYDTDSDCISDSLETKISNISLILQNDMTIIQQVSTAFNGVYGFNALPADTYTVHQDTIDSPFYLSCLPSGYDTIIIDSSTVIFIDRNFSLQCKPGFDIGTTGVISTSNIRPGTAANFVLHAGDMASLYGVHCTSISGTISLTYSGPILYTGVEVGSLLPDSILPSRLVWNIADFSTIDFFNDLKPIFFIDSSATLSDYVCFTSAVTPTISDRIPSNNTFSQCFVVRASYDPNIKEVSPSGTITADQDWLYYTIHFQNTGNSYAENIYVWDTIDTHLDINSIQVMGASHNQFMNVFNSNRSVRFNFLNIMLEDSTTNEPASHGWVQYRIKPNAGLSEGSQIHNTASILFDLNAPVVTNTITNRICNTTSTITQSYIIENGESVRVGTHTYTSSGLYTDILSNVNACDSIIHTTVQVVGGMISNQIMRMIMYPNPANHQVLIQLEGYPTEPLHIFDMYGRKVFESESISNKLIVNTESWHAGTYIIQCGNKREKLVVHH